uniref:Uncharacterized protein n=1 Tax=Anguilla anguilla TaxID=7936 RepID=A0A0E9SJX5_ANGAN
MYFINTNSLNITRASETPYSKRKLDHTEYADYFSRLSSYFVIITLI